VHLRVGVGAGIGQDGQPVVEVGRLADGGQHDPAGGDAPKHQGVRVGAAQQHVKVAAAEGADPPLDDDRLVRERRQRGVHLGRRVVLSHRVARLADPAEAQVAGGGLRIARAEPHPDEHHRDARRPGGLGGAVGRLDDGSVGDPLDDAVLEVHQQQDGTRVGHGRTPPGCRDR
jgi:hypothetical protein